MQLKGQVAGKMALGYLAFAAVALNSAVATARDPDASGLAAGKGVASVQEQEQQKLSALLASAATGGGGDGWEHHADHAHALQRWHALWGNTGSHAIIHVRAGLATAMLTWADVLAQRTSQDHVVCCVWR
jgi:hypothetical protein